MIVELSISYESKDKTSVCLTFPNAAEARRELLRRAGRLSWRGTGQAGSLVNAAGKVMAKYRIHQIA